MKKLLAMLLVLAMAVSMLVGCGGNAGNSENKGSENKGTENVGGSEDKGDEEVYEIVYQMINFGFDAPDLQMVQDEINKIIEPEIGVRIKIVTTPIFQMASWLSMKVSGEEKVDLVQTGLLTTPSNLYAEGLLMDITSYIEGSEILSSKAAGIIDACKVGDKIVAYPGTLYPAMGTAFTYDAAFAEEYGIVMPERFETAEDWENVFKQVKKVSDENDLGIYAIALGDGANNEMHWNTFEAFTDSFYIGLGAIMDPENSTTIENWYATDLYMEKSKIHRDWVVKGYAAPDTIDSGLTTTDAITQGVAFGSVNTIGVGQSLGWYSQTCGKELKAVPVTDPYINSGSVINASWGIPVSCENPEKVIKFLEVLYTNTDVANLLNLGVEGVHYEATEGTQIVGYPEGVTADSCGYGSFIDCYGDKYLTYHRAPLTDEFIASIPSYGPEGANCSKFMGYSFDTSSVAAEVAAVVAAIQTYGPALSCGTVDPETTIPEFLEALEAAGINTIIAENQRQLDAWLAEQ